MLTLIGILAFATSSLTAWAILRPKEDAVLRRVRTGTPVPTTRERRLEGSFTSRTIRPGFRRFGSSLANVLPHNLVRKVDHLLVMADEPWTLPGFLSAWAASAVFGVLMFAWVMSANPPTSPMQMLGLGVLLIPFPALVPYAVLRRKAKNRHKQITHALPDALDLLTTCVEAGTSIDAAFVLVTERTEGPLSDAFSLYLRQVGLGRSRKDALNYVAGRAGVQDLENLAAAINQGEELGTTMGDVLRQQAQDLRALRRQRAQEAAQRAPVLMTIPLALCFLPAMGAVVVVPSILNLIDFVGDLGQ